MLINNADVGAGNGATFERRSPVTDAVVTRAAAATVEDARAAVDAAGVAVHGEACTGPGERRALLLKAAALLEGRTEDVTARMMGETGCIGPWAGFHAMLAAGMPRATGG